MVERMTAAELRQLQAQKSESLPRVRGAQRVTVDGEGFDSKAEADRWGQLRLLEKAGQIRDLRRQVKIGLEGRDAPILSDSGRQQRVYVADFTYFDEALGATVIEDRKGHATEVFNLKKAILAAQGIQVLVT